MEIIGLLAGKNKVKDYQIRGIDSSMLNGGIIEGLEINETGCSIGKCLILIERTNGQKFLVDFYNTEFKNLTLGNDKKIYIEIPQNNIDDGNTFSLNTDGTGIAEIKVGNEFPNKNFVALAETDEIGEITDLREIISFKGLVRKDLKPNSIIFVNSDGDEQLLEFNPETDNGKAVLIDENNGLKLESTAVNIGDLTETTTPKGNLVIQTEEGNKKISEVNLLRSNVEKFTLGEAFTQSDIDNGNNAFCFGTFIETNIQQTATNSVATTINYGQTFITPSATGNKLRLFEILGTSASGTITGTAELYSSIGGTLLATSNSISISSGTVYRKFIFNDFGLLPSTSYYIRVTFTNNFNYSFQTTDVYSGGTRVLNGSATSGDIAFKINFVNFGDINKIYKTNSGNSFLTDFKGFVKEAGIADDEVLCDVGGVSNTQTGVTIGSDYYLSNTPGAISTTFGVKRIGTAISNTGILIEKSNQKQLIPSTNNKILNAGPFNSSTINTHQLMRRNILLLNGVTYGNIRASVNIRSSGGSTVACRFYKNGVALGTEFTTSSTTNVTFTLDISARDGDTIELWARGNGNSDFAITSNFNIGFDITGFNSFII